MDVNRYFKEYLIRPENSNVFVNKKLIKL